MGRGPGAPLPIPAGRPVGGRTVRGPAARKPEGARAQPTALSRRRSRPHSWRRNPASAAGLLPSLSQPGCFPTPLSAPLKPAPRIGAHAAEPGSRGRAAQGASTRAWKGYLPGWAAMSRPSEPEPTAWVTCVDESQEVCCRSGQVGVNNLPLRARGLPPVPVTSSQSCLCLGKNQEPPFH